MPSLLLVASLFAQTVVLDPLAGVWFPPYGKADEYLERKRSYSTDLRRAFQEMPATATQACQAVATTPKPGAGVDPRLRQMRMMFDMACVSFMRETREAPARETHRENAAAYLAALADTATTWSASARLGERAVLAAELLSRAEKAEPGAGRFETFVRAMLLAPRDPRPAWYILLDASDASMSGTPVGKADLAAFVEQLYRTRGDRHDPEAAEWRATLPEILLYLGKFDEARQLQRDRVLQSKQPADYDRALLALLERTGGAAGAVDAALADCKSRETCTDVVWSAGMRSIRVLGTGAPATLVDAFARAGNANAANWPVRLETARMVALADPKRVRREMTAMYAAPDIPAPALIDLIMIDAGIAGQENDSLRSIALVDCWLALRELEIPPFPSDGWKRLAAMPETDAGPATDCSEGAEKKAVAWDCTAHALRNRLGASLAAHSFPLARQTVEKIVAYTLAGKLTPSFARDALETVAAELSGAGLQSEAATVAGYLEQQPHGKVVAFKLKALHEHLPATGDVVLQPWPAQPDIPDSALPRICAK
jgi:hypothetical protein